MAISDFRINSYGVLCAALAALLLSFPVDALQDATLVARRVPDALPHQRTAEEEASFDCGVIGLASACLSLRKGEELARSLAAIEHGAMPVSFVPPVVPHSAAAPPRDAVSDSVDHEPRQHHHHHHAPSVRLRLGGEHRVVHASGDSKESSALKIHVATVPNMSSSSSTVSSGSASSAVDRANAAAEFMQGAQLPGCPRQGKTIFLHVMKTAGLAVDAFLNCQGTKDGWSIMHHDGKTMKVEGDGACHPSVCTLHGAVMNASQPENCGPSFENASVFTVLRNPVDRVWSFFNYLKDQKKYTPYQTHPLDSILSNLGTEDLNEEVEPAERCSFCHTQLFNPMVLYNFAGPRTSQALANCVAPLCLPDRETMNLALKEAKANLAAMRAVYLMEEDLPDFASNFAADSLLAPKLVKNSKKVCDLPHNNPSASSTVKPDNRTADLIRELNWADIALYDFAKTLSNRVRA